MMSVCVFMLILYHILVCCVKYFDGENHAEAGRGPATPADRVTRSLGAQSSCSSVSAGPFITVHAQHAPL